MLKVGFTGVPGSGKTSTARALAAICRRNEQLRRVELIDEYARWYINTYGGTEHVWEQVRILNKQLSREAKVPVATTDLLLTDSPISLCFAYALDLRRPGVMKDTMVVSDLFKIISKLHVNPHYDLVFHVPPLLEPVRDGTRPEGQFDPAWRSMMNARILAVLDLFRPRRLIQLTEVSLEGRAEECLNHLTEFLPVADDMGQQ